MDYTLTQQFAPAILSDDDDFLAHTLEELRRLIEAHGLEDRAICLEETNSTLWQRDLSGGTCYRTAWLAKTCARRRARRPLDTGC